MGERMEHKETDVAREKRRVTARDLLSAGFLLTLFLFFVTNLPGAWRQVQSAVADGEVESRVVNIQAFSANYDKGFFGKFGFIDINGLARRIMAQRVMNERVKMDNGYLTALTSWDEGVRRRAEQVLALEEALSDKGIPVLFGLTPQKVPPEHSQLPAGIRDYANQNADAFLERLRAGGMEPLDLRASIREQGLDHVSLFFRTDHHQKPETGFWMFQQLAEWMHRRYGYALDAQVMNRENYRVEVYPGIMLGNDGKRTGRFFAGLDDMELLLPTFETDLSLAIPSEGEVRTGDFDEVMFQREHLTGSIYTDSPYLTYIGDDYPLVRHENPRAIGQKRILVLKDSCVLIIQPYFSLWLPRVDVVDLRYFKSQSLMTYIEETAPDAVLILYSPTALAWDQVFSFF